MDAIISTKSIGISELRRAPVRAFKQAKTEAIVVLSRNKPAGYIVSTELMVQMLDQIADQVLTNKSCQRIGNLAIARRIMLDDL